MAAVTSTTTARRTAAWLAASLTLGALTLSACATAGSTSSTTTTTTLPPLPPTVSAYVALAGAGNNFGFGHFLQKVDLTPGATGLQSRIPTGSYPDAVAVMPNGTRAYVTNYASNSVTPINLVTGKAGTAIPVGEGPSAIAIAPDGLKAYVTNAGTSALGDTVTPLDLRTDKPLPAITVGPGPQGIVITPNGSMAYVSDAGAILSGQSGSVDDQVTPIDLTTGAPEKAITVGNAPIGLAVTPDGGTVFVANLNSESVTPIAVSTNTARAAIAVPGGPIAMVATQSDVWVVDTPATGAKGDNVVDINLLTSKAGTPIPVGKGAQAIALAPGDKSAWVACLSSQTIVPIDLVTRAAGTPIAVPGGPFAIAIANQPSRTGKTTANHRTTKPKAKKKKKAA
jgi:YVTN family beta-propeller protein